MCEQCAVLQARVDELEACLSIKVDRFTPAVEELYRLWKELCSHPNAKLTSDRRTKVRARLRDGYSVGDIASAIRGASKGAFVDTKGHRWDDLSLICRNGSNVERFMAFDHGVADEQTVRNKFLG